MMHQNYQLHPPPHQYHHHHNHHHHQQQQRHVSNLEPVPSLSTSFGDQSTLQQTQQQRSQYRSQVQAPQYRASTSSSSTSTSTSTSSSGDRADGDQNGSHASTQFQLSSSNRLPPLHRFDLASSDPYKRYSGTAPSRPHLERLSLVRQTLGESDIPSYRHYHLDNNKDREMHANFGSSSSSLSHTSRATSPSVNEHGKVASAIYPTAYSSTFRPLTHAGVTGSGGNSQTVSAVPNRASSSSPPTSSLSAASNSTTITTPGSQAISSLNIRTITAKNEDRRSEGSVQHGSFSASYQNPHQHMPATAPVRGRESIDSYQQQQPQQKNQQLHQQHQHQHQAQQQQQQHQTLSQTVSETRTAPASMLTHESPRRKSSPMMRPNDETEPAMHEGRRRWDDANDVGARHPSSPYEAGDSQLQRDPQSDDEIDFDSDDDNDHDAASRSESKVATHDDVQEVGLKRKTPPYSTTTPESAEQAQEQQQRLQSNSDRSNGSDTAAALSTSVTASNQPPRGPPSSSFPPLRKSCDRCFKMKTKCSRAAPGATGDGPCVGCVKRGHKDSCITSRPDAPFPRASSMTNKRVRRDLQHSADPVAVSHLPKSGSSSSSISNNNNNSTCIPAGNNSNSSAPFKYMRDMAEGELESAAAASSNSSGRIESSHNPKRAYERFYSPESPDSEARRPEAGFAVRKPQAVPNSMSIESMPYGNGPSPQRSRPQQEGGVRAAFVPDALRGTNPPSLGHAPQVKARAMPPASSNVPTAAQLRMLTTTELRDIGLHVMSEVARRANTLAAESQQYLRQEHSMPQSNINQHQAQSAASQKLPQAIFQIFLNNFESHIEPLISLPHVSSTQLRCSYAGDRPVEANALTDIALAIGVQLHAQSLTASQTANAARGKIYRACFESEDNRRPQHERQADDIKRWLKDVQCRAYALDLVRDRGSRIGQSSCQSILEDLLLFHFYSVRGELQAAEDCAARARRATSRLQDSWNGEKDWSEAEARYLWRRVEDAECQSSGLVSTRAGACGPEGESLLEKDSTLSWTEDDAFHELSHLLTRSSSLEGPSIDLVLSKFRRSLPHSLAFSLKHDWMTGVSGWIDDASIDRSQPTLKLSMCLGVCYARLVSASTYLSAHFEDDDHRAQEANTRCYETASAMMSATFLALNVFPDIAAEALRYATFTVAAAWSLAVTSKRARCKEMEVVSSNKQAQEVRQLADLLDSISGIDECAFAVSMRQAADVMEGALPIEPLQLAKQGKLRRLMLGDTTVRVHPLAPVHSPIDDSADHTVAAKAESL